MTTHARTEQLLATAIDFSLTPAEHGAVTGHLATCPTCRALAAAYRTDASALRAIAFAGPPARVRSAILTAAALPAPRTIKPWKLLAAAALLLAALLGAFATIGTWNSRPTLVVVVPSASSSAKPAATPAPSPSAVEPPVEPTPYAPPAPKCPAPATAARLPDVTVSVGGAPGKLATLWGSGTTTCSTTGSSDGVPSKPTAVFSAGPGDRFTLVLPSGWKFLHVDTTDRATTSDAAPGPPIDTPDRPSRIDVPVTAEPGESIVGFGLWIISDDERVVAGLEVGVRVRVSAAASPPPSGTGTLTLAEAAIRTVPSGVAASYTAYGSRAFEIVVDPKTNTLTMLDLASGDSTELVTLAKNHAAAQIAATDDRLIWVETWRDNPSPPTQDVPGCVDAGKPLRWGITSLTISMGVRSTIDGGTNVRTAYSGQCADVSAPVVATDGDRVAYTREATTTSHPFGDQIVVRSVANGSEIHSITTDGMVEDLNVVGSTIAYRENTDDSTGILIYGTGRLMVARADQAAPVKLDDGIGALAFGGTRLAWVRADATPGSVWTTTLGSSSISQILAPVDQGLQVISVWKLAVTNDLVAWSVNATIDGYDAGGCCATLLSVWATGEPTARFIEGFGGPDAVAISSGWLLWHTNRDSLTWHDDGSKADGFYAVRLQAVAPPWP